MSRPLEYCCVCDAPTGRAGQGEDSLYTSSGKLGPYCEDCWDNVEFWRELADSDLGGPAKIRKPTNLITEIRGHREKVEGAFDTFMYQSSFETSLHEELKKALTKLKKLETLAMHATLEE